MMSQRYGLTYPSKSGFKAITRKSSQGSLTVRTTDTDNEEWESEVDKIIHKPPQWTRKRSYITRLQKQNRRRFLKTASNSKCNKNLIIPTRAYIRTDVKIPNAYTSEEDKHLNEVPTNRNTYCIWTKVKNHKAECPSTSKISVLSKVSLEKKSIADWKLLRRKHIVNKFDRFSKGILKMTGKLSSETVHMITAKIKENLERKEDGLDILGTRECSRKKTVSFIKKILKGTSVKLPAHHRKKPQKKYNLVRQSLAPNLKVKSAILPKLLHLKSGTSNSSIVTRSMQTSTRTLYRSQSELLVKSSCNIKVLRSFSEASTAILTKSIEYSTLDLAKDSSSIINNPGRPREDLMEPILVKNLANFKHASSKKIINVFKRRSLIDCSEPEISGNASSSSTVASVKVRNAYNSYRRPIN